MGAYVLGIMVLCVIAGSSALTWMLIFGIPFPLLLAILVALPIPFANQPPAVAQGLISLGLIEREDRLYGAAELVVEVLSPGGANERRDREVKLRLARELAAMEETETQSPQQHNMPVAA